MTNEPVTIEEYELHTAQSLYRTLVLARLTPTQADVWNTMLSSITSGTRINMSQQEIAEFLQVDAGYVSRAARRLKELGLIWRPTGSGVTWHVNVRLAFKGPVEEWVDQINEAPDEVPQLQVPDYRVRPPRRSGRPRTLRSMST
ncbi:MarR family transcriptional regulator [Nocardiopsis sp. NPDC006198]|uniref:MarR family transcriptional regulator n=1 Tax=Nocardiopsis sp. NPDC006198 TaxID=3154472 RepID=UPI0033A975FE